ncbi:hypothetical protein ASA1KI_08700 [Opitutales bacterium ASA1]|uniref:motility associated factor glycosyltransferase family protein n=1 Tax=Congregicoccus parvus TaxID=3081749 RepID=UPI002B308447|nr:hypothetical protein ASA1KI_08700 [Opitutales bacterium ASA1]
MSTLDANLGLLAARFPQVAVRVRATNRYDSLRRVCDSGERDLLAELWLGGREWKSSCLYCLSGGTEPWLIEALLKVLPADAWLFVAEVDAAALGASLVDETWGGLLSDPRVVLGTGPRDDGFFSALDGIDVLEVADVEPLVFGPLYDRAPAAFAEALTAFAREVDTRRKLWGTALLDAPLWQENTLRNLARLAGAPDVSALRGAFVGRPMVLISAGPSLDESLDFVRECRSHAILVAVNSSYRAVRRAGVVPDFVLAADPRGFTARGFAGVEVTGSWLVTTPIVHPDVVRMFEGRCFTWSGSNVLFTEIRRRRGLPVGTSLAELGTVSACAIDLAVLMGCDRICLVGQDLAVRADGRSHVIDSFYTDLDANRVETSRCRLLPGNTLESVPVEEKLFVYLKAFEQLVASRRAVVVRNTSRLGARIAGADYSDFDEALKWLRGGRPGLDTERTVRECAARGTTAARSTVSLRSVLDELEVFARDTLRCAMRVAARAEEGSPEAVAAAAEDMRRMLAAHPRESAVLEGGRMGWERFTAGRERRKAAANDVPWTSERVAIEEAWAVAEGAWALLSGLEAAREGFGARADSS